MRTLVLVIAGCAILSAQPKTLFYMNDSPASIRSFQANASKIDLIAPTVYSVDAAGLVWGKPDSRVLETALESGVERLIIVFNHGKTAADAVVGVRETKAVDLMTGAAAAITDGALKNRMGAGEVWAVRVGR
ncbi:MAG: glycoside hydrolase, family 18 [Candidatus Solibacter sp.]|jgi:hypothetical protein|nr:glycoside hydrolase, family 18 [Candidatus Solibacter sp.]